MTNTVSRLSAVILAGILAAVAFNLYTFNASANYGGDRGNDGDRTEINIENEDTEVENEMSVTANTGGNRADGGDSGQGGGQKPPHPGGLTIFQMPEGQGGNAGPGGDGGTINTGAATAYGTVYNDVNSSRVVVEGCGCEEGSRLSFMHMFLSRDDGKNLEIGIENEDTEVENELDVLANTGRNSANGGDSRGGGSSFSPWTMWFGHFMGEEGGGDGGTIRTGGAYADGFISNVVNRSVVRVLNGADEEDELPPI